LIFAVLHQRLYNIKWIACSFLYIIFAVLLKFERSLNSYFVSQQKLLLLLPAGYITVKFNLSTSKIGGRDIAVCAKIQDGDCRHLEFFCSIFWHFCM